jgi:hypothetical protein
MANPSCGGLAACVPQRSPRGRARSRQDCHRATTNGSPITGYDRATGLVAAAEWVAAGVSEPVWV